MGGRGLSSSSSSSFTGTRIEAIVKAMKSHKLKGQSLHWEEKEKKEKECEFQRKLKDHLAVNNLEICNPC